MLASAAVQNIQVGVARSDTEVVESMCFFGDHSDDSTLRVLGPRKKPDHSCARSMDVIAPL